MTEPNANDGMDIFSAENAKETSVTLQILQNLTKDFVTRTSYEDIGNFVQIYMKRQGLSRAETAQRLSIEVEDLNLLIAGSNPNLLNASFLILLGNTLDIPQELFRSILRQDIWDQALSDIQV